MSIPGYLSPVRVVFRRTQPHPDRPEALGQDNGVIGHIYVRWLPEANKAHITVWYRDLHEQDHMDADTPAKAGEHVLHLVRTYMATYKEEQERGIAKHLAFMETVDMPHMKIQVRDGFRPISAAAAHHEFKTRVNKEAEAVRASITESLQRLVVAGWITPQFVDIPEFNIPDPKWKPYAANQKNKNRR